MISLLYPENYRKSGNVIYQNVIESLELDYIAMLICPYNTDFALRVLTGLITDESVIKWRQDILEDFMNVPQLELKLYKSIHTIYENALSVYAKSGSTQSFFELNENIKNIESFLECMEDCHKFIAEHGATLKSEGVKAVLMDIENRYNSNSFKKLINEVEELKSALNSGIKSVTFGVNFDNLLRPSEVMLLSVDKESLKRKTVFEKLLKKGSSAEPLSEIYSRKSKDGTVAAVNEKLFSELDKLGGDYVKRFNTAINLCYEESTDFLVKLAPQIDFYVGAKKLCERIAQLGLPYCRPEILPKSERRFIFKDMHDPVLSNKLVTSFVRAYVKIPVHTNDCTMDDGGRIFIITGTNNGGKTTYIRAAAVNQILAQAGLNVFGTEAKISPCDKIFVHYPKEEKVGIDTSRFTEECKALKETVSEATEHSLILMNESLSSTNPYDSLIIGEELLKIFADKGSRLLFTTHVLEMTKLPKKLNSDSLKSCLVSLTAGCDEEGRPNYKIAEGTPDFSRNAKYIFEKYGISFEAYKKQGDDVLLQPQY